MESDNKALRGLAIIRANLWPYIVINILYYGLVLCGMTVEALYPAARDRLLASHQVPVHANSVLDAAAKVYQSKNIPLAALVTFLVNSIIGAFASITLPSALIPFSGFVVGLCRPAVWGIWFSSTRSQVTMLPRLLVLLIEGQAYILAIFGSYLWGRWVIHPTKSGFGTRTAGYRAGLRTNMQLYSLILATLAVSAIYEAVEVIGAMPPTSH